MKTKKEKEIQWFDTVIDSCRAYANKNYYLDSINAVTESSSVFMNTIFYLNILYLLK